MELHEKLTALVVAIRPWGVEIVSQGGEVGIVDKTKLSSARGQSDPPKVGEAIVVVVLDETRVPFRASALADDIEIARKLKETSES